MCILLQSYPTERAVKKSSWTKYIVGGLLLFLLILIIWFPLLVFSLFTQSYEKNLPTEVTLSVGFEGYHPLLKTTAVNNIKPYSAQDFQTFINRFPEVKYDNPTIHLFYISKNQRNIMRIVGKL